MYFYGGEECEGRFVEYVLEVGVSRGRYKGQGWSEGRGGGGEGPPCCPSPPGRRAPRTRSSSLPLLLLLSSAPPKKEEDPFSRSSPIPSSRPISQIVTETLEKCDDTGKKKPWPSAAETSGGEQGGADRHHRLLGFQFSRTREAPRASLPFLSFRRGHDDGGDPVDPCR